MTYRQRTKKEPSARGDYIITLTRGFVKFFSVVGSDKSAVLLCWGFVGFSEGLVLLTA